MSTGYQIRDQSALHYLTVQVHLRNRKDGFTLESIFLKGICAVRRLLFKTTKSETFAEQPRTLRLAGGFLFYFFKAPNP